MTARRIFALGSALLAGGLFACSGAPAPIYSGTLSGTAGYKNGAGGANIAIALSGPASFATLTDGAGHWSFNSLPPGNYSITAVAPSALEPLLEAVATVGSGPAIAPSILFTGVGSAAGNVTLGAAQGNAGIVVVLSSTGQTAITDDAGDWSMATIPAGQYTAVASRPGLSGSSSAALQIAIGETTQAPALILPAAPSAPGAIHGSVQLNGVAPQSGIVVSAQGPVSAAALTQADGSFSMTGLPDGQYAMSAQVRSTLEGTVTLAATIASGLAAPVVFQFSPVGSVSGVATRVGGSDNSGISITSPGAPASTLTDALGRYQLVEVAAGTARIEASYAGAGSSATQVAIPWDGEAVAPALNLAALPGPSGEIRGTATFANQADASGISVALAGPTPASQVTGADGSFDFTALAPGNYLLTAAAADTVEGSRSLALTVTDLLLEGEALQLTPVGSLQGLVTYNGAPAANALVFVNGTGASGQSAADGSYRLDGVPAGLPLAVQASTSGFLSQLVQVAPLTRGEVASVATLTLASRAEIDVIAGGAQLLSGAPAAGATVTATAPSLTTAQATAGADGSYSLLATDGVYSLALSAPDGSHETIPGVAAFSGGTGLLFGEIDPQPLGTIQLQRANRLLSTPMPFVISMASQSSDPVIQTSDDALVLSNYSTVDGDASGTLSLLTGGQVVPMPAPFVFAQIDSGGIGTTTLYGPTVGPEHTALYVQALNPGGGTLYIGRADGTATALANEVDVSAALLSGGHTVAFPAPDADGDTQIFAADVDQSGAATQITNDTIYGNGPLYVTADGAYIWYWAYYNGADTLSVVPSAGCGTEDDCPVRVNVPYYGGALQLLAANPERSALLLYASGSNTSFIASPDGTQALALDIDYGINSYGLTILPVAGEAPLLLYPTASGTLTLASLSLSASPLALVNDFNFYGTSTSYQAELVGDTLVVGATVQNSPTLTTLVTIPTSLASAPVTLAENSNGYTLLPDGQVAYDSADDSGDHPLVVSNLDGSSPRTIDPGPVALCCAVDAAGDRLAWVDSAGGSLQLTAGTPLGGTPSTTTVSAALGSLPSLQLTPDGKTLAVGLGEDDPVVLYQPDSGLSGVTTFVNYVSDYSSPNQQLLADGTMVFPGYVNGARGTTLVAANLTSTGLTENSWPANPFPGKTCAADLSACVFYVRASSSSGEVTDLIYASAGGQLRRAAADVNYRAVANDDYRGIDLSPDQQTLLFRSDVAFTPYVVAYQPLLLGTVQTLRLDGTQTALLGDSPGAAWQPDGSLLTTRAGSLPPYAFQDGIYTYPANPGQETRR